MLVRLAKLGLVILVGLFLLLVGIDNLLDPATNFVYVQHVMSMDTVPPSSRLALRAIASPAAHKLVYALIISTQLLAGVLCLAGALLLWVARRGPANPFNRAKQIAVGGLALAFALWFFGFMAVGGEWFQMWQSPRWNGQQAAFRFIGCVGLVLVFLVQKDEELA